MSTNSPLLTEEQIKDILGKQAAELPQPRMVVGLGTGTTAHRFIIHLAARCRSGLPIQTVSSSEESAQLAREHGIPVVSIDDVDSIDLTVDGADEIDSQKRMIKGAGAALLREKIVAFASRKVVIIAHETKVVTYLGNRTLPVEVLPFAHLTTMRHIEALGYTASWRYDKQGKLLVTDNGNYIFDITFPNLLEAPELDERHIAAIPGVIETGFFFDLADEVMIGHFDGRITTF